MKYKKNKMILLLLAIFLIFFAFFLYRYKPVEEGGAIHYSPEICKKVEFEITKIECEDKKMKISLFNAGSINLNDTFLVIISTEKMQAFVGSSLEKILKPNQISSLTIDMRRIEGAVNRMEIVFQPCPFSTKVLENLAIEC